MSTEHFDAVIVGSGFGGAVMAYRLAEAGMSVCVLERGRAWPPGSFPRTPHGMAQNFWDPSAGLYGLFNVWSFRHINALVSSGLGGGSLIYANVLLRKDEKWFVREEPGKPGWEHWPVTRAELDPHYDAVERMMDAQRYPLAEAPYSRTPKTIALRDAAARLGLEWQLPPLAVTFANRGAAPVPGEPIREDGPNLHGRTRLTCTLCGECDVGCNTGAKNTLDYTYLTAAWRHGAELRTLCEVKDMYALAGGGYGVRYAHHDPERPRESRAERHTVTGTHLVVAAGTLGTNYLLLRNRGFLPALQANPALGDRFCGNGDLLTFAIRCRDTSSGRPLPRAQDASYGPVITSAVRVPDALDGVAGRDGRGCYIEDAGYPAFMAWLLEMTDAPGSVRRFGHFAWSRVRSLLGMRPDSDIGAEVSKLLGTCELSMGSVPLLGMGRDVAEGRFTLREERLENDWKMRRSSPYFDRLRGTMKDITDAFGGRFADNMLWHLQRRVITVHPLGGAAMGRVAGEGVVDGHGEVFGHPGLYVTDGAAMPGPVGANPALTIAAFADRAADHLIEGARHARAVPLPASPEARA